MGPSMLAKRFVFDENSKGDPKKTYKNRIFPKNPKRDPFPVPSQTKIFVYYEIRTHVHTEELTHEEELTLASRTSDI